MRVDRIIDPDMTVDEVMRRWPATIAVVLRHGMLCVGCPIGPFHTVTDACIEHGVDETTFVRELIAAIRGEAIFAADSRRSA
jgi:hybrid cluster-associated redox disulfide protein